MVAIIVRPVLQNGGFHNTHFADAVVMFLVIPFSHLINDEEIKAIIAEESWYRGIRHMVGQ